MRPNTVTTAQLADLIRPFVGAKINRKRDPASKYGCYLPLTSAIDIHAAAVHCRADVRAVTAEGVEAFFYRGCDLIPWSKIRGVVIHGLDADEDYTSEARYEHVGAQRRAA